MLRARRLRALALMTLGAAAATAWWLPSLTYQVRIAPAVTADLHQSVMGFDMLAMSSILAMSALAGGAPGSGRLLLWQAAAAVTILLIFAAALNPRRAARGLVLRTLVLPALFLMAIIFATGAIAPRYLIILLPGSALAIGVGFETLRARRPMPGWLSAALLLGGLLALTLTANRGAVSNPWLQLSGILAGEIEAASDAVVLQPPYNQRVLEYYYTGEAARLLGAHHYDDFYARGGLPFMGSWSAAQLLPRLEGSRRVWLLRDTSFGGSPPIDLPYEELGRWTVAPLELTLYELPTP
jgi:hypothetical protein